MLREPAEYSKNRFLNSSQIMEQGQNMRASRISPGGMRGEEGRKNSYIVGSNLFPFFSGLIASPRVTRDFANLRVSLGHLPQKKTERLI